MTKLDEIWNKRFLSHKSSILLVYMPIMPLVLATPYDLSFAVKSIKVRVSAFIEGATSNIRWTPSWTRKIDPFSSFCSLTPLMMQTIQYMTHLWKTTPITHFFFNKYVIHLVMEVPLGVQFSKDIPPVSFRRTPSSSLPQLSWRVHSTKFIQRLRSICTKQIPF